MTNTEAKKCPNCKEFSVWDSFCYSCDESVELPDHPVEIDSVEHHNYQVCGCEDYPCCGH